jgi:hypothetical protein
VKRDFGLQEAVLLSVPEYGVDDRKPGLDRERFVQSEIRYQIRHPPVGGSFVFTRQFLDRRNRSLEILLNPAGDGGDRSPGLEEGHGL